ncbi:MAG: DUF559 domain-containing protein [Actinomycetota bacterium]
MVKRHREAQPYPESADRLLSRVAAARYGVFTREEALREGATRNVIQRRLRDGRWERIQHGVYRLAGVPQSWRQSLAAACLAAGEGAVSSHRAAGQLWDSAEVPRGFIEISIPRTRGVRPAGATVHRVSDLSPHDVVVKDAIPVTTPARTLIDLAGVLSRDEMEEALDDALRRGLVSLGWLRWRIESLRRPGRPGIAEITALCEARSGHAALESVLETRLLRLIVRARLPHPVPQYVVRDRGRFVARVDFAYPEQQLAIEADGYKWHSHRRRWERDVTRGNALLRLGWRVVRVTARDVKEHPGQVAETIAAALVARR